MEDISTLIRTLIADVKLLKEEIEKIKVVNQTLSNEIVELRNELNKSIKK